MTDAQALGVTARAAMDKVARELPAAQMVPATVVQSQQQAQFGEGLALVHVDGDPAGELRQVSVIDGRRYSAGTRVNVEYVPPQGAVIRGAIECVERQRELPFSFAGEIATGDESAPGTFTEDSTIGLAIIDVKDPIGSDLLVSVQQNGSTILALSLSAGDTRSVLDVDDLLVLFNDGPLYAVMDDDGGGGYTSITMTLLLTSGCTQAEGFNWPAENN